MQYFILICIFLILWGLCLYICYKIATKKSPDETLNKYYQFPDDMSRTQRRLFEKQINQFKATFNNFSNYQLSVIKDLIESILESRL